jgi:hypothetical protein
MKRIFLLLFLALLLCGCNQEKVANSDTLAPSLENINDINDTITISEGIPTQNIKAGEHFSIVIINNSEETIFFPPDYNLHIYILQDDQLIEVENNIEYPQKSEISVPPFPQGGMEQLILDPIIPSSAEEIILRVVASGNTRAGKKIGTYYDLIVSSKK